MAETKTLQGQQDNSLLLELVKGLAVLTSKFDTFEKVRSEDNVELKDAIKKVDDKVDRLDAKFEARQVTHDKEIAALKDMIVETQKAPLKDKAEKWESAIKLILETLMVACLGVVLVKVGLK
jgi:hypothetical protein